MTETRESTLVLPPFVEADEASFAEAEQEVTSSRSTEEDDDEEYDTDIEIDDGDAEVSNATYCIMSYLTACDILQITPAQKVIDYMGQQDLNLKYRNLGPSGSKALAAALLHNTNVERVNLEECGLGPEGVAYLAAMLKLNIYITHLNLTKNLLGGHDSKELGDVLQQNDSLTHLILPGNQLDDHDAESIAAGLEVNERIVYLDLSRNSISEEGAVHIGRAIGFNNSVEVLDLSWNQVRKKGAVALCTGLKRNYCITTVNLSWNGFGYEGALAVGELLRGNKYLRDLDVSSNRINWDGAMLVARGLKENDTLECIKVGHNPLTMTGCLDILEAVGHPLSIVSFVGFDGIPVNGKVVYTMELLQKTRQILMSHGGLLDGEDIFGKRQVLRCDPLKLLIQFLSDKGIRPVDLFRTFDKDNQHRVSREQFIQGLKRAKAPLDDYELERVLNRLDTAKEGKISYQRLMRGVKEQLKVNRAEERRRQQDERRQTEEHRRIMSLPSIGSGSRQGSVVGGAIGVRSATSLSQRRTSSASSYSTGIMSLPPVSLRSQDPHLVNSKTSVLSKASSSASRKRPTSLPRINMAAPLGRQLSQTYICNMHAV